MDKMAQVSLQTKLSGMRREHFNLWLSAKPDDEIVGRCQDPRSCVVSNYIHETILEKYEQHPGVTGSIVQIGEEYYTLPGWCDRVVREFDSMGRGSVTATEARKVFFA